MPRCKKKQPRGNQCNAKNDLCVALVKGQMSFDAPDIENGEPHEPVKQLTEHFNVRKEVAV